jgi:hypothetical protein
VPWPPATWNGKGDASFQFEFTNGLSRLFAFRNAVVVIDGRVTFSHEDEPDMPGGWPLQALTPFRPGTLHSHDHFIAYAGPVSSGEHTIEIGLGYRGNGGIGGYWFSIKSSHKVTSVAPGQTLHLTALAYEKGGPATPVEQRPTIEWKEHVDQADAGADADVADR